MKSCVNCRLGVIGVVMNCAGFPGEKGVTLKALLSNCAVKTDVAVKNKELSNNFFILFGLKF